MVALVHATCLYVATKLGDFSDDLVVVGGLVPSLLIEQNRLPEGAEAHVGTVDLDIGLAPALLTGKRYRDLTERLRRAGFSQDVNERGEPTRQRWAIQSGERVTIDFLIEPTLPGDKGGSLRDIEGDFAAFITPGLHLAFQDREIVRLSGRTILGAKATRDVWVCGPGAYVVLKALAFVNRSETKDAYDLVYVLRNYGRGVSEVAEHLRPLLYDADAKKALGVLRDDFQDHDALGPIAVSSFQGTPDDDDIRADVVGLVGDLLRACG